MCNLFLLLFIALPNMGSGGVVLVEEVPNDLFYVQPGAGQIFGESLPAVLNKDPVNHVTLTSLVKVVAEVTVLPEELHVGAQEEALRPLKNPSSGTLQRGGDGGI